MASWETMINASWAQLTGGDILGASISSYTNVLGAWFYLMMMFMGLSIVYLKTKDFGTVTITGMLVSAAAIPFMPGSSLLFIASMTAFGIALILYKTFHK